MNLDEVDGRFGEAAAGTAPNASHINLVIGRRGSPTAAAAAGAMADVRPGHAPLLLCLGAGNLVRPATVVRNKTTIDSEQLGLLTWGAAQLGIGQGVCDAVDEGLIPLEHVDDLVLLIAVWVDAEGDDHTATRLANRAATRAAIADALQPDHRERAHALIVARERATNRFYRGD
jgi:5,6,7,8-tetrahydromethanopterin hydro-lyase